jgi:hypothetical protein
MSDERKGCRWSQKEDAELLSEISQKMNFEEISIRHKRSVGGIVSHLKQIVCDLYREGNSMDEIRQKTGLPDTEISFAIQTARKKLSKKDNVPKVQKYSTDETLCVISKVLENMNIRLSEICSRLEKIENSIIPEDIIEDLED